METARVGTTFVYDVKTYMVCRLPSNFSFLDLVSASVDSGFIHPKNQSRLSTIFNSLKATNFVLLPMCFFDPPGSDITYDENSRD